MPQVHIVLFPSKERCYKDIIHYMENQPGAWWPCAFKWGFHAPPRSFCGTPSRIPYTL